VDEEEDDRLKKENERKKGEKSREKLADIMGITPGSKRLTTDVKHAKDMIKVMRKTSLLVSMNLVVTFVLLGGAFIDMVFLWFTPIDLLVSAICTLFLFQVPTFNKVYRFTCRPLERILCFFVASEERKLIAQKKKRLNIT